MRLVCFTLDVATGLHYGEDPRQYSAGWSPESFCSQHSQKYTSYNYIWDILCNANITHVKCTGI